MKYSLLLILLVLPVACSPDPPTGDAGNADPVAWATAWANSLEEAAAAREDLPAMGDEAELFRLARLDSFLRREISLANRYPGDGGDLAQVIVAYHRSFEESDPLPEPWRDRGLAERALLLQLQQGDRGWRLASVITAGDDLAELDSLGTAWNAEPTPRRLPAEVVEVRLERRIPEGGLRLRCGEDTAGPGEFPPAMEAAIARGAEIHMILEPGLAPAELAAGWVALDGPPKLQVSRSPNVPVSLHRNEDGTVWSAVRLVVVKDPRQPPPELAMTLDSWSGWRMRPCRVTWLDWNGISKADLAPQVECMFRAGARSFQLFTPIEPRPFVAAASPEDQIAWLLDQVERVTLDHAWEMGKWILNLGTEREDAWLEPSVPWTPDAWRVFRDAVQPLLAEGVDCLPVPAARERWFWPRDGGFDSSYILSYLDRWTRLFFNQETGIARRIRTHPMETWKGEEYIGVTVTMEGRWDFGGIDTCFHLRRTTGGWRLAGNPVFDNCDASFTLEHDLTQPGVWRVRREGYDAPTTVERFMRLEVVEAGKLIPDMADDSRGHWKMYEGRRIGLADGPELTATGDELRAFLGEEAAATRFQLQLPDDASYQDVMTAIDVLLTAGVVHLDLRLASD